MKPSLNTNTPLRPVSPRDTGPSSMASPGAVSLPTIQPTDDISLSQSLGQRQPAANDPILMPGSLRQSVGDKIAKYAATPEGAAFNKRINELHTEVIAADDRRGIKSMMIKQGIGDPLSSIYRFAIAKSVAVLVGFKVPVPDGDGYRGIQETDGPLGAAFMALACVKTRKPVSVICDRETQPLVEACLGALAGDDAVNAVRFLSYEGRDQQARSDTRTIAAKLSAARTDLLISVEVAGRNSEGKSLSMRGIDITDLNPDYDTLINSMAAQMDVVAIGDGGNEAGFGGSVDGVPKATNGATMQAATGADHAIPATVSNWGGYFMFVGLMRLAGKNADDLPTVEQHNQAIAAMLQAGSVDGCTLNTNPSFVDDVKKQQTGVDGMSINDNGRTYLAAREFMMLVKDVPFQPERFQEWDKLLTVMMFDSSDGVFHAAKVAIPYLEAQLPGQKTYVLFGDHGNAPYGTKTPEQLEDLVRNALNTLRKYGLTAVIFACNTACIGLDRMQKKGIEVTDINLIKNTSGVIVESPYARVGVLGTAALAASMMYQNMIQEGLDKMQVKKDVSVHGCPGWAELVNAGKHISHDESVRDEVNETVRNILAQLDPNLDAIYLCCTHYPALTTQIREIYGSLRKAKGITAPFAVVDPMKKQAETATDILSRSASESRVISGQVPILVLTTGNADQVRKAAAAALGREDFEVKTVKTQPVTEI